MNRVLSSRIIRNPNQMFKQVSWYFHQRMSAGDRRQLTGFFDPESYGLRSDFRLTKFSFLRG